LLYLFYGFFVLRGLTFHLLDLIPRILDLSQTRSQLFRNRGLLCGELCDSRIGVLGLFEQLAFALNLEKFEFVFVLPDLLF
jgi:hypothetical protein